MTKMLTLFGKDLSKMHYKQLEREWRSQRQILTGIKEVRRRLQNSLDKRIAKEEAGEKKPNSKLIVEDKLALANIYIGHLESFIGEIEYWMSKRTEPLSNTSGSKSVEDIRVRNAKKQKAVIAENKRMYDMQKRWSEDSLLVSWDKEKFVQIAADRGYQTQEALIWDVGKELNLDRARAGMIIEKGRFTWGQVLCLGAMLQMTPKEFCDTFLTNYFTDHNGEYRADYENVSREELLKQAVRPKSKELPPLEYIEVDDEGKPLDEEIWFDE